MSVSYKGVNWDRTKRRYDAAIAIGVGACLAAFIAVSLILQPASTAETLLIRSTGLTAMLLLHVILCIGPLARFDRRFLLLHYNRRHLGVTTFLLGLVHAGLVTFQYHGLGDRNPIVSALTAYGSDYLPSNPANFPFEVFGAVALIVLFLLAATSHDFWLRNLGASFWKAMHQGVYLAYGCLLVHVAYGAIQSEKSPLYPILLGVGFVVVVSLHFGAARIEARFDRARSQLADDGFVRACAAADIAESCGKVAHLGTERVAFFRHQGRIFASSNVCRHQGGPLGEGRIVDGCITCPWHGWNYRVEDGMSPPFKEIVSTYRTRIVDSVVYVHPEPLPQTTRSEGAIADPAPNAGAADAEFFVGYRPTPPRAVARLSLIAAATIVLLGAGVLGVVASAQNPVDRGTFEFGNVQPFEGIFHASPVPTLSVAAKGGDAVEHYLLVGFGKHGVPEELLVADGMRASFRGTLIHRDAMRMIEVTEPDSIVIAEAPSTPTASTRLVGEVALTGEIIDMKCFLGVMRPAVGKVHRGCAIRCLSGGVPAGLRVVDQHGDESILLLAGEPGEPLELKGNVVGVAVEVRGDLSIDDGLGVLRVRSIRRL